MSTTVVNNGRSSYLSSWCVSFAALNPISYLANAVFARVRALYEGVFPTRTTLTSEEVKPFVKYVAAAQVMHANKLEWITPFGYEPIPTNELIMNLILPNDLKPHNNYFFDPNTGLKIALFRKENQVIIAFGTLGCPFSEMDHVKANLLHSKMKKMVLRQLLGRNSEIYEEAKAFVSQIKELSGFKGKEIMVVGSCFGGSLATYTALHEGLHAHVFNTLPLGVGLQYSIGRKNLPEQVSF